MATAGTRGLVRAWAAAGRDTTGRGTDALQDTTELESLRAALRDAERRLQAVVGLGGPQLGTLEFALDEQGQLRFVAADATAGELITVAQPAYFGRPALEVFTGMAGTELPAGLAETASLGTPLAPCNFVPPGTRLARAFTLFAFQSAPGRAVVKFWCSDDEPAHAEVRRRNEELLTRIFAQAPVAIGLVRDADARIVDVNECWSRLTGIGRAQALGRTALELGLWPGAAIREQALGELRRGDEVHELPLEFDTPDGRHVHAETHASRVTLGCEAHLLIYHVDATARHRAEEDLRRANARLEARVAERTAELARARDEAERASRSKSDFLSGMSHELRTPMNAILGFAQLLAADNAPPLSERQRGHVRHVLRAGTHLMALINEVLDLARIEAGKLQISLEPVDLAAMIEECLTLMQPVAQDHGVDLAAGAPPACTCHVRADRTRLRQVLLNLLSNAIKYNREHGRVWLRCEVAAQDVRIEVSDTGPGLSAEQQRLLFRDFERLGADQVPIEGTGIGLALSRRLMGMMHGEIGVDSEVGRGSTFWLRVPRCAPAALPAPHEGAAPAADHAAAARQHKVLYVEDNPVNVALMEAVLARRPGLRLIVAPLPGLGLDIARAERPDLILVDIQLPGMDGYELLRRLRQAEATRHTPVFAISANALPADVKRGHEAGFMRYLTKPFDVAELLAAVDEALAS